MHPDEHASDTFDRMYANIVFLLVPGNASSTSCIFCKKRKRSPLCLITLTIAGAVTARPAAAAEMTVGTTDVTAEMTDGTTAGMTGGTTAGMTDGGVIKR